MKRKQRNMLGVGIIVILILFLGVQSFSNALSFYYEVDEFVQKADTLDGKIVNVNGTILKGSTVWMPEKALLTFKLADKNSSITVVSNQGMPGNYKEGIPAVVTGIYINGTFEATQVVTKCPSKYGGDLDQPLSELEKTIAHIGDIDILEELLDREKEGENRVELKEIIEQRIDDIERNE